MVFRIIPRLDIKGPNLVKGVNLEGLRVLGDPVFFAEQYYNMGADEILYMDVVASLYERNSLNDLIRETAKKVFIPITVGGGIRKLSDISDVLKSGADKVLINTAAIKNPNFIYDAAREFGSSTIVVALEAIAQNGVYTAFFDNGREYTGLNVKKWAKELESLGAGEMVLTSVDRDGTGEGFDNKLIKQIENIINIPIIVHGGAGNKDHILKIAEKNPKINGVSIASIIHFDLIFRDNYNFKKKSEGNIDFLKRKRLNKNFETINIDDLKKFLMFNKIEINE